MPEKTRTLPSAAILITLRFPAFTRCSPLLPRISLTSSHGSRHIPAKNRDVRISGR
jgi:hypothetical protein